MSQTWSKKTLRENALSLTALSLFVVCIVGQALTGRAVYNEDAISHGRAALTLWAYLGSGAFVEAVFENWESEFLQMAIFVVLTKFLYQKGSSESKPMDGAQPVDEDPRKHSHEPNVPWPVRKGGVVLAIYERSLSTALVLLFAVAFVLHAYGGMRHYNEEQSRHGGPLVDVFGYLATAKFWEESFQNWQSEFLSVAVLVLFSVWLRERGSPQSKAVAAPHDKTGEG